MSVIEYITLFSSENAPFVAGENKSSPAIYANSQGNIVLSLKNIAK